METKGNIAVKLTKKNCKKVLGILEMFGEDVYFGDRTRWSDGIVFHNDTHAILTESQGWKGFDRNQILEYYADRKEVKPLELRNILAKEHLKAGQVIVCKNNGSPTEFITKFLRVDNDGLLVGVDYHVINEGGLSNGNKSYFNNFLRYATDEEKALLEPKVAELKIEAGKSYRCIKDVVMTSSKKVEFIKGRTYSASLDGCLRNESGNGRHWLPSDFAALYFEPAPEFGVDEFEVGEWYKSNVGSIICFQSDGKTFGIGYDNVWCDSGWVLYKKGSWRKATEAEVIQALTKECVKRYGKDWENVKIKVHADRATNHCNHYNVVIHPEIIFNKNGNLFYKGKWAEPLLEPTPTPKRTLRKIEIAEFIGIPVEQLEIID